MQKSTALVTDAIIWLSSDLAPAVVVSLHLPLKGMSTRYSGESKGCGPSASILRSARRKLSDRTSQRWRMAINCRWENLAASSPKRSEASWSSSVRAVTSPTSLAAAFLASLFPSRSRYLCHCSTRRRLPMSTN